jgi:hypothetical protein
MFTPFQCYLNAFFFALFSKCELRKILLLRTWCMIHYSAEIRETGSIRTRGDLGKHTLYVVCLKSLVNGTRKQTKQKIQKINFIGLQNIRHPLQHTVGNVHKASGKLNYFSLHNTLARSFYRTFHDLSPTILTLKWLRKKHSRSLMMSLFCRNM